MSLTLVATVIAFVIAIFVIKFFMGYISKKSFMPFVIYRIALGIIVFILLGTGVLDADGGAAASAAAAALATNGVG